MRSIFLMILLILLGSLSFAANLYQVLGVPPDASQDTIKKTWRLQIRALHPDRADDNDTIRAVNAAENVLGNPELRAYYDFLSNYGADQDRWEQTPGKTILETLRRRYGPVEALKGGPRPAAASAAENSAPGGSSSVPPVAETNPARQNQIIDLILRKDITEQQRENVAKAIARFVVRDALVASRLRSFAQSEDPQMRSIGLLILKSSLQQDKTSDFSSLEMRENKLFLLRSLSDANSEIRLKALQALSDSKIIQDREIFAQVSELAADSSFPVAWEAQSFLTAEERLQQPENFWNFLKFLKKHENRSELKILRYNNVTGLSDKEIQASPLQALYHLRQLPDDEDIRRELVDLLSSENTELAKVVARLLFRSARGKLDYGALIKIQNRSELLMVNEQMTLHSMISATRMFGGNRTQDPKPLLIDLSSRNPEKVRMSLRLLAEVKDLNESQLKSVMVVLRRSMLEYRQTGSQAMIEPMRSLLGIIQNSKYRGAIAEDLRYFAYNVGNDGLSVLAKNAAQISPTSSVGRRPVLACEKIYF